MVKEYIILFDYALCNEETGEAVLNPQMVCELVRCNDCDHMKWKRSIYADGTISRCRRCELDNKEHPNDWFCAEGKPKGVIED